MARLLADSSLPRSEARRLLALALETAVESLIAHPQRPVDAGDAARFAELCARRAQGEPLAYLAGEKEFYGRRFAVSPAVLVPRPETELLVEVALTKLEPVAAPAVLDLGTGSGCIAISLALERTDSRVLAVDRSAAALEIARANAARLGAEVEFALGDWSAGISGRFDLIVANPPYVAAADPHLAALRQEPQHALVSGDDGLDDLRRIVAGAPQLLVTGGTLIVEHGYAQAAAVRDLFAAAGFGSICTCLDLAGVERACLGSRPD